MTSNRRRGCRASVARPLTSRISGGCLASEGDFRSNRAVVPTADPAIEMSEWTVVVLVETSTCRSRRSVRGLDLRRESGVRRGLVGAFGHRQKTRGHCPGRPAGAERCEGLSQGCPAVSCDGRYLGPGRAAVIDVPAVNRDQATGGEARFRVALPAVRGEVPEVSVDRALGEPKRRRSSRHAGVSTPACVDRTEAGERAVKRAATGARSWTSAGFPTALGGWSPEVESTWSARDVNVGCRSGVEAS